MMPRPEEKDAEPPATVPSHGAPISPPCEAFELMRPESLHATAPGFSLRRFCQAIITSFNSFAATPGTTDGQMEACALHLLAQARDDFVRLCPAFMNLFSAWAFCNARSLDAAKTGAHVFLRLMTWVNPFPDSPADLDCLLDICDALGCKYTLVMLAFGLYPDFRPQPERRAILDRLSAVAHAVHNVPPAYLARNRFLDRAVHFAASLRSMHVASCTAVQAQSQSQSQAQPPDRLVFPTPTEVSIALQWCLEMLPVRTDHVVHHLQVPDLVPAFDERAEEDENEGLHNILERPLLSRTVTPDRAIDRAIPAWALRYDASPLSRKRSCNDEKTACPSAKRLHADQLPGLGLLLGHCVSGPQSPQSAQTPCDHTADLVTRENALHRQFADFAARFHDHLNLPGLDFLQYLVMQHGELVALREAHRETVQPDPPSRIQSQPAAPEQLYYMREHEVRQVVRQSISEISQRLFLTHQRGEAAAAARGALPPNGLHATAVSGTVADVASPSGSGGAEGPVPAAPAPQNHENKHPKCQHLQCLHVKTCPHFAGCPHRQQQNPLRPVQPRSGHPSSTLTPEQARQVAEYQTHLHAHIHEQVRLVPLDREHLERAAAGPASGHSERLFPPRASYTYAVHREPSPVPAPVPARDPAPAATWRPGQPFPRLHEMDVNGTTSPLCGEYFDSVASYRIPPLSSHLRMHNVELPHAHPVNSSSGSSECGESSSDSDSGEHSDDSSDDDNNDELKEEIVSLDSRRQHLRGFVRE